jgi:hypothetical protein
MPMLQRTGQKSAGRRCSRVWRPTCSSCWTCWSQGRCLNSLHVDCWGRGMHQLSRVTFWNQGGCQQWLVGSRGLVLGAGICIGCLAVLLGARNISAGQLAFGGLLGVAGSKTLSCGAVQMWCWLHSMRHTTAVPPWYSACWSAW